MNHERTEKVSKKKPLIVGLVILIILGLGVAGFALANNGNGEEYIPEIVQEYEEEIAEIIEAEPEKEPVEEPEEPEEIEPNTDIIINFLVDESVAHRVLERQK